MKNFKSWLKSLAIKTGFLTIIAIINMVIGGELREHTIRVACNQQGKIWFKSQPYYCSPIHQIGKS